MTITVHYHFGGFPPSELVWERLIPLIGPANAAVARYDGLLNAIPNAAVLLSPLMTQEAVLSSRIEGTEATMGEVLEFEAESEQAAVSNEKRNDIEEILNYRRAMRSAEKLLKELPICQRVIRAVHAVLLDGVRGHNKSPGEYRKIPNWIGPAGCSMEQARYVPISAAELPAAMGAWEQYIHEDAPDRLVQLAVLHAEFLICYRQTIFSAMSNLPAAAVRPFSPSERYSTWRKGGRHFDAHQVTARWLVDSG